MYKLPYLLYYNPRQLVNKPETRETLIKSGVVDSRKKAGNNFGNLHKRASGFSGMLPCMNEI